MQNSPIMHIAFTFLMISLVLALAGNFLFKLLIHFFITTGTPIISKYKEGIQTKEY